MAVRCGYCAHCSEPVTTGDVELGYCPGCKEDLIVVTSPDVTVEDL